MKFLKLSITVLLTGLAAVLNAAGESSADKAWTHLDQGAAVTRSAVTGAQWVNPVKFEAFSINEPVVRSVAEAAPNELQVPPEASSALITVPRPDGSFEQFQVVSVPTMEPGLAAQFPGFTTFKGVGVDDPAATVRGGLTSIGFHASVRDGEDSYNVDALYQGNTSLHVSYYLRDSGETTAFECGQEELAEAAHEVEAHADAGISFGTNLRTYRAAIATTGEYAAAAGGNVMAVQAVLVTLVNRVNQIFEVEVAVRLVLVANNNLLIFLNPVTDGYTNGSTGVTLTENQNILPPIIGAANYDIGHVMNSTGGGRASLGVVCNNATKARGTTGIASGNVLSNGSVIFLAHEMGHMFNASHVWNGVNGNCTPAEYSSPDSYEPGSGSTIMSYAGTCGTDNVIGFPWDPYYHRHSLNQIINFITGTGCPGVTATGNNPAQVNAGTDIWVPVSTPFKLKAAGTDPDGDTIFYTWEQFDTSGVGRALGTADPGNGPLFRSVFPNINPARYLPVNPATPTQGEQLPTVSNRDLNFIVTARDFRTGGGGTNEDAMVVHVIDAPVTPFRVTVGNIGGEIWGGTTRVITWDVAGTDTLPYNIFNVNIMMSVDGGATWPYLLAENVPNDGSQLVGLPNVTSTQTRIRVEPSLSGVYDISDANITVGAQIEVNPIVVDFGKVCPGDVLDRTIEIFNTGSGDLTISSVTKSGSTAFSLVPSNAAPEPVPPVIMPPGDHVNYTVRLTAPATPGVQNATITIMSNDPARPSVNVSVMATVGTGNIVVEPCPMDFGLVCPEDAEARTKTLSICNTGECPLTVSGITLPSMDFTLEGVPTLPVTLQSGACLELTVKFTPTSVGPKMATLTVTSNDPDMPILNCSVTGETVENTIGTIDRIPFEPTVISTDGHCPNDEPLLITGTGLCNVDITTVTISGTNASSFKLVGLPSSAGPISLAPGEQLGDGQLHVRFEPSEMLTERFHMAQVDVTYIKDPFTLDEETVSIPIAGEACNTGFRMLVRAGGVPVDNVLKITATVKGLNANGKKSKINLKQTNATLRGVDGPTPFETDMTFQYHAEYGALTNSTGLPTGEVLMKVQYKIGNKKKTKTVKFQTVDTCTFNQDVVVDF